MIIIIKLRHTSSEKLKYPQRARGFRYIYCRNKMSLGLSLEIKAL